MLVIQGFYELYLAIFKGVVDAPVGHWLEFVPVNFQDHPLWFSFSVLLFSGSALLLVAVLSLPMPWDEKYSRKN